MCMKDILITLQIIAAIPTAILAIKKVMKITKKRRARIYVIDLGSDDGE